MASEIGVLSELTNTLLQTVHKSTLPLGRRNGTGADVQALIRRILDQNQQVKEAENDMREHQARQAVLRSKAREVVRAEQTLANFVNQFGDIEARLSRILHSVAVRRPESPTMDSEPAGDRSPGDERAPIAVHVIIREDSPFAHVNPCMQISSTIFAQASRSLEVCSVSLPKIFHHQIKGAHQEHASLFGDLVVLAQV
jgi:hypothetical protein